MSRCYRDSALFVHLSPGDAALSKLANWWETGDTPLAARLLADSDPFAALAGGPLTDHLSTWQRCAASIDALPMGCEAATEALALAIGSYHLLSAVSCRLEAGQPVEGEAAALATLLELLADLIAQAQAEQAGNGGQPCAHFPEMPEVDPEPLAISYDELVHIDDPYDSGDFLRKAPGNHPQFIPEIQLHDPALRDTWKHCYQWFLDNCSEAPDQPGPYEHYMERLHTIPPEMLVGFKKENFFASVVPTELDGLGWKKVGYYLLVSGAMRFGDASLSLLIMASTSIGTTPALIGRDKEIPLVAKELGAFKSDPGKLKEIGDALNAVVAQLAAPDPKKLQRDVTALVEKVDATIRHTKVVKYLAQNFLMAFYGAALAGKRRDFAAFSSGLKEAQSRFDGLQQTIEKALTEVPRRELATDQFLRALGNGAVAAFALTEPTAGSDSGGVTTIAHLKSTPVTPMGDGRWRFEVDGQERFLLDAERLDYQNGTMVYRLQCGTLAPVSCDSYNYADDTGTRTVEVLGEVLPFHDIGQVRDSEIYEFYEVSGAKMWITNGRCATQFSMYVKTDEGITGIMVDRHAEGLIVGRDEEKMGQQGSPTNELSIDRMRVPRENVIGYEGHGQVNALDTLNVGRCGLAVAGVVMTRRMLVEAKQAVPESDAARHTFSEVAARTFANESLVFHLIGRFDNKSTRSVRLESAIAKYTCSELLHDALDRIEPLWGPQGQTREMLVEKMRRDARILNIYEGTNEVQRFLILRELCGMVATWEAQDPSGQAGQWAAMTRWKETLRQTVGEAVTTLGDSVWQDAAMQTAFFPLTEMAGELYLLDATLYRLKWLESHQVLLGDDYTQPMLATGKRAATQCLARLQIHYDRYNRGRADALNSRYPVEAVASDAAMEAHTMVAPAVLALASATTITCLLRPLAVTAPTPRLGANGQLSERLWRINPADEHGLSQALAIKAAATKTVTVNVISCGGSVGDELLREALGAGADRAVLLALGPNETPDRWADAILTLPEIQEADLLLSGDHHNDADAPLMAFLAGRLNRDLLAGDDLSVNTEGELCVEMPIQKPAVATVSGSNRIRATLAGMARATSVNLDAIGAALSSPALGYQDAAGSSEAQTVATNVASAAALIKQMAEKARRLAAPAYDGEWETHALTTDDGVWAIAQGHETEAATAYRAAVDLGQALGLPSFALAVGDEQGIHKLAGIAQSVGITTCYSVDTKGGALSEAGRRKLLSSTFAKSNGTTRVLAPADWQQAIGTVAGSLNGAEIALSGVTGLMGTEDGVVVSRSAYGAKLNATSHHGEPTSLWLTVADAAAFKGSDPLTEFVLAKTGKKAVNNADMDANFIPPVADLKGAEVIVDMGLGAGTPAGMALGEQLMDALSALSLTPHMGATRKVTQGLGLLPQANQIGQTGITVKPRLILCLGISGAPQHTDYIGSRAQVIAFNKDPEAPIMSLDKAGCTVHPIVGDLFETVGELVGLLGESDRSAS
jgi:butyryl-CoA dehydrogenase